MLKNSIPIDQAYPKAFKPGTGINVSPGTIHRVENSYSIDHFPESEKDRNHYSSRGGTAIKYLIMHYTVENFAKTVDRFIRNIPSGRTSAHFVITQKEDNLKSSQLPQVVPESMSAWHAGVSFWKKDRNLNAASIGIEHVNQGFTKRRRAYNSG